MATTYEEVGSYEEGGAVAGIVEDETEVNGVMVDLEYLSSRQRGASIMHLKSAKHNEIRTALTPTTHHSTQIETNGKKITSVRGSINRHKFPVDLAGIHMNRITVIDIMHGNER
eukprot:116216_1